MKRIHWISTLGSIALACFSLTATAAIWVTSGNGDTNLYSIDGSGAIIDTVGDTGQTFTGLAYHSGSGMLYGTTSPASATTSSVFTIDPATGAATLVGAHGIDSAIIDLTFADDGTLYGWLEPGNDDLVTINLGTGAATVIGDGPSSGGRGIEFTPGGDIALFNGSNAELLDPLTGLATGANIPLTGSGVINGSFRVPSGLVYAINFTGGSGSARELISVDFTTGDVVTLGTIPVTNASGLASDDLVIGGGPASVAPVPALGYNSLVLLILLAGALGMRTLRQMS